MYNIFTEYSYYVILALVATWAFSLLRLASLNYVRPFAFVKENWRPLGVSLVLTAIVFISVPPQFRVLSDETNLLSVAKSMTFNKDVQNITEGKSYYEMFWPQKALTVEKRPFVFPFFTSVFHNLLGYRIENVFIMNFFVLWMVLFLMHRILRPYLKELWIYSALVLLVAQPMFCLSASSASYEVFNLLFILASLLSLRYFLKVPSSQSFLVLVLTLIMLSNVRYESIIFPAVALPVLLAAKYLRFDYFKRPVYLMVPFFTLPWLMQRVLMLDQKDSNLNEGSWVKAFDVGNIGTNLELFWKYVVNLKGDLGYAGIINFIGIVALVYFLGRLFVQKQKLDKAHSIFLWTGGIGLFILFMLVISYQGGINDHPINGRLYIPILALFSALSVCLFASFVKDLKRFALPIFMGAVVCFLYYHPFAVEDRLSNQLFIIREYKYVIDFLKKNADENTLVIVGRPGQYIVSNYGAMSFDSANKQSNTILTQFGNHLFSQIFVVQAISYKTGEPLPDNALKSDYKLKTLAELQVKPEYFFRISTVVL